MENERKLLKIPLGFRSKIPRRGIREYQISENFARHNALCKADENYGILMGKPNNAICLDYDIYDSNCEDKQKYTLEYFKKVCGDNVYVCGTPSGGVHVIFQYDSRFDSWKNATKIQGFIDIRTRIVLEYHVDSTTGCPANVHVVATNFLKILERVFLFVLTV